MSFTLCSSGAAIANAGANASSVAIASSALLELWSNNAEGRITAECHTDFVTNTPSETLIQNALSDICSSLIAMDIVSYDLGSYPTMREAETILDKLDDRVNKGLFIIRKKEKQRFST